LLQQDVPQYLICVPGVQVCLADVGKKSEEFSQKLEYERNKYKTYEADLKEVSHNRCSA
jgi:hypothetical protein